MWIKAPPVRLVVAVIVVLPVVAVAIALTALLFSASRKISESLGESVVDTQTAHVADEVRLYLTEAVRVSDLYARRLQMGTLPLKDLSKWEPLMADDLFTSRHVASICFGTVDGEATYLQLAHGRRELGRVRGPLEAQASEFEVDGRGQIVGPPLRVYRYDPRQRPWYTQALRTAGQSWTLPYFWFGTSGGEAETGCGYTRVINDAKGQRAGVLTVDVTLGALSDFLHSLPFAQVGSIFIIDERGMMVAASHGTVNSVNGERLALSASSEAAAKVAAQMLATLNVPQTERSIRMVVDGKPARMKVAIDRPYKGIDWRIITVMPESAFLANAQLTEQRAVTLAFLATVIALILSLLLGRRIAVPLRRLTEHVTRIGNGDFASRLELYEARELNVLATATNEIAGGLKHRLELEQSLALATQVQQSLLPQDIESPPGLDIAAVSRYADSTGGDYFDVVPIERDGRKQVLIAVGDVTGHGIAAALLMATARAALHTAARRECSPAAILAMTNSILAANPRRDRYMTMALLSIDPVAHSLLWSSAGHDPVLLYDPNTDRFTELPASNFLLGAIDGVAYTDQSCHDLHRGTIVFAGTDGIWEARNATGDMYGKDRLRAFIKLHAHRSAAAIGKDLEAELNIFRAGRKAADDMTYAIVKFAGTTFVRHA